jgi:AdoMet-dependent heme synthase
LMLATPEKMKRLRALGLDHILTSWCSSDPAEMDYIMGMVGSYEKVVEGIRTTTEAGIRVSVNTIVSQNNKNRVYESGQFLRGLGVTKFFAHRVVPPAYDRNDSHGEHHLTPEDARETLDELLRLKQDTGMIVGTLISYPLCMLGDLEKYADFVGRGCPSQSGHRFSINSNGETHCCVMEDKAYGNVFELGLREVYAETKAWHDESYHYEGCEGCHYINVCESGCRMSAFSNTGKMNGRDPLMVGKEAFVKPFKFRHDPHVVDRIEKGMTLTVPPRLRFRKEDGFYLLNIRWGNTIIIDTEVADFLIRQQKMGLPFSIADFEIGDGEMLADLLFKDALESNEIQIDDLRSTQGVSLDPSKLPTFA